MADKISENALLRLRITILEEMRLHAQLISDNMKPNQAEDQYIYLGGMNPVEDFRASDAEYVGLLFEHGLDEYGDEIEEEEDDD
jgi:hypothetical protein